MHPQQVVKLGKYHHERSTEEVCWGGEDEEESKGGEGEVCVREGESKDESRTTQRLMFGWCCMYIFGVGGQDGGEDECGGEGE